MGDQVRWPGKIKVPPEQRDKSKWCDFHQDHGHKTDDCISLRFQVSELLKRGYLEHLLEGSKKQNQIGKATSNTQPTPANPPIPTKMINFVNGGSCIMGTSYSAAKRHVKTLTDQIESLTIGGEDLEAQEGPLAFFDHEINDQNHDDALVISIDLVNC